MAFFEELLCGDELGTVFYYSVEWNGNTTGSGSPMTALDASMTLLRRIVLHTQQICGLAWSGDGEQFATGGNDNLAFLFNTADVVGIRNDSQPMQPRTMEGGERYRWAHGAAVKAIAFCPWQRSLLATGILLFPLCMNIIRAKVFRWWVE
jgi:meiosis-specific APC/C activator protein AMA1